MVNLKKKKSPTKKEPLTQLQRSEIANRAVQARRKNNPNWGVGVRAKEAKRKEKLKETKS